MDWLVGRTRRRVPGRRDGDEGGPDDAIAQPVAPADLVDDLALGAAGAGDAHDRFVLARVERRAGGGLDLGHSLALEELAQLAVDGDDPVGPRVVVEVVGPGLDRAV